MSMSKCININDPAFQALVKDLNSEIDARVAVIRNNYEVPSPAKAREILRQQKVLEKDTQFVQSDNEFKLERVKQQQASLLQSELNASPAQKATLGKLQTMLDNYTQILNSNIQMEANGQVPLKTVSVSNFIGVSEFKGDPKEYEAFKLFGIFVHGVLEELQTRAINQNVSLVSLFNKQTFAELLNNFQNKTPFTITDLSNDEVYDLINEIIGVINIKNLSDYLILPEVTLVGKAKDGTAIVGRADMLFVDSAGHVTILDFKTKKLKGLVTTKDDGTREISKSIALGELADAVGYPVILSPGGTAPSFLQGSAATRNSYDTWQVQTDVYGNILAQNGIPDADKQVIALLYETDKDKKFLGAAVHVYETTDFYKLGTELSVDEDGVLKEVPSYKMGKVITLRKAVDTEVPYKKPKTKAEPQREKHNYIPSKEQDAKLRKKMEALVDSQLSKVYQLIEQIKESANPDTEYLDALDKRRTTLNTFKNILERTPEGKTEELVRGAQFAMVLNAIEEDIRTLKEASDLSFNTLSQLSQDNPKTIAKEIDKGRKIFLQTQILHEIINTAEELLNEMGIKSDSPQALLVGNLKLSAQKIEANFREIGIRSIVHIFQSTGDKRFTGVSDTLRGPLTLKKLQIEEQLTKLKNGEGVKVIFSGLKNTLFSLMDKSYKEKMQSVAGKDNAATLLKIQDLELKLMQVDNQLRGLNLDEASLRKYIEAITNVDEFNYIGATDLYGNSGWLQNLFGDEWIASASNSDPMIAIGTLFVKQPKNEAEYNLLHDTNLMALEKAKEDMRSKGWTVEQLNAAIGEWREISYLNHKTGQIEQKREYFITKPMSKEYEETYTKGKASMTLMNLAVSKARSAHLRDSKNAELKKAYLDAIAERETNNRTFIRWMLNNCILPYTDDFYEIQAQLPEDIRNELQEILMEIETISYPITGGSEVILSEEDWERLNDLEIQKRELRDKAKKQNPVYAEYLAKFDSLYEYDINYKFYEASEQRMLIQYADDPEAQQAWYKQRRITRPKKEWYNELAILRDKRAYFFGSNPVIADLYKQKYEILGKYISNSQIDITRISDEEIRAVEAIEEEIGSIIADRDKLELSEEDWAYVNEITQEINRMSSPVLSKSYQDEYDTRTHNLETAKKDLDEAIVAYNNNPSTENENRVQAAQIAFTNKETEYEIWFNKYHKNKYTGIQAGASIYLNKIPRAFNYDRLPIKSEWHTWMEEAPNPKYYKIRRLRTENWYYITGNNTKTRVPANELEQLRGTQSMDELMRQGILVRENGAYNPNFIKTKNNIPMPKGIVQDAEGKLQIMRGYENNPNINPAFLNIRKNGELSHFYDTLTKVFFGVQKDMDGRSDDYRVPGFAASAVETLVSSNYNLAKYAKKQLAIFEDKNLRTYSEQDITENLFGESSETGTRMRFNRQLPESMQTQDIIGAVFKYAVESHYTKATQDVGPYINSAIDYLKLLQQDLDTKLLAAPQGGFQSEDGKTYQRNIGKRSKELGQVIKMLEYERNKNLYGQMETDTDRKAKKVLGGLFGYIAFIRLGFDVTVQVKNYFSGSLQSMIAASGTKGDHYSIKDWAIANRWVYGYNGFLANYMKDWGRISNLSLDTQRYRLINPLQKDNMKYYSELAGSKGRRLANEVLNPIEASYMIQDKGDTIIGATTMYAVMNAMKYVKLDANGQPELDEEGNQILISANDCYELDEQGLIRRRTDVAYTKADEEFIRTIIYSEIRRAQGNYAKPDQTFLESMMLGKMIFFFRKFLVPLFLNRFGYMRPDWEAGNVALGYWRALADCWKVMGFKTTMKEFLVGSKMLKKFGTTGADLKILRDKEGNETGRVDVGNLYVSKIGQARRDAIAMIVMTTLSLLALSYIKRRDDDDDELSVLEGNALRVLWGVKGEATAMLPIGTGSSDYIKNFTTAIPFVREGMAMQKFLAHSFNYGLAMIGNASEDSDSEYWQEVYSDAYYSRKSGAYEKGTPKIAKDLVDLTGIRNIRDLFQPVNRLDVMRKNQ